MAKMKESFPPDFDYAITLDTTDAVRAGMHEIVHHPAHRLRPGHHRRLSSFCKTGGPRSFRCWRCLFRWWGLSLSFRCSVFPSIRFHCLAWCWPSDWWSMTPLSSSRAYNGTSRRAWPRKTRLARPWQELTRPGHWHRAGPLGGVRADRFHPGHHRKALPAIRHDHRHLRDHFSFQRADLSPALAALLLRPKKESAWAACEIL